ncbi:MAG TPA: hypothetical protein DD666_13895 [Advenella kashmirensis]|uniref:Hedgehog/Intein (Hint) domain-containing protein n=1 Tax=Advenella kashmirensis TaxID=310575 RepID=A0A356LJ01_9BURK|nr:hypothetical protein [Advenella kashmirensis]
MSEYNVTLNNEHYRIPDQLAVDAGDHVNFSLYGDNTMGIRAQDLSVSLDLNNAPGVTTLAVIDDSNVSVQAFSGLSADNSFEFYLNYDTTLNIDLAQGDLDGLSALGRSTFVFTSDDIHHSLLTFTLPSTTITPGTEIPKITYMQVNDQLKFNAYDESGELVPASSFTLDQKSGRLDIFFGANDEPGMSFDMEGTTAWSDFELTPDGLMTYSCYLKGTHIATPHGEVKVEELKAGDRVRTATGGVNTVKWIGFRKLNRSQLPAGHTLRASPIRICQGAFADNIPHRDLTVSPGHRFNFDGALVPALSLVNGITITQDFDIQQFEYYHVELEKFDMLLAEGAAAESYLEVGSNRNAFENANTVAAHPDFGPAPERVVLPEYVQKITPEIIETVRRDLFARVEVLTGAVRTADADLRIEIGGKIIAPQSACRKKGQYRFQLPSGLNDDIHILSNAAVVRETSLMDRTDTRVIGVGLAGIVFIAEGKCYEIGLNDASVTGLNEAQEMNGVPLRWTTGKSIIPAGLVPTLQGPVMLELNVLRTHMYWNEVEETKARLQAA